MTRVIYGVDPDTKATGIARIVEHDGVVSSLACFVAYARGDKAIDRMPKMAAEIARLLSSDEPVDRDRGHEADVVVIEYQHVRPRDPRPNDIMAVQAVAGMAILAAGEMLNQNVQPWGAPRILTPIPVQWKGSVPKAAHQPRIIRAARAAGIAWLDNVLALVPPKVRTHCVDALGLALWAAGIRI